jgi:hypothetical protein
MHGMKRSVKTSLIIIALALVGSLASLVWLGSRPNDTDETVSDSLSETSRGPSFEVRVVMPRSGLPLGGILPDWFVKKFDGTPRELRFDHTSLGAQIGSVGQDRLELSAEGWELIIETDSEGRITPGTHLVFPLALGGRRLRLDCRAADRATGYLNTTTRAGSDELVGRFLVELATCKNAESGKATNWPPAALTVRGSFVGPATQPSPALTGLCRVHVRLNLQSRNRDEVRGSILELSIPNRRNQEAHSF